MSNKDSNETNIILEQNITQENIYGTGISEDSKEDKSKKIRKSHENPEIIKLYKEFLGEPMGNKSHELLHTEYFNKNKKRDKNL